MLARNGTYWRMLAFSLLQLSFNIHSSNGFSCPIKFFHLKIAICLRNHRKTLVSSVYRCLFPREGFPRQTYINQVGWKHGCKLQTLECRITLLLRQPWEELVPWERTPWHWSQVKFRPLWLFHKGCLSLHSCQTAMLPHVGKLNSANSAFSNFHSTFVRAMGSVVLSSSFIWTLPLGWPWTNLGTLLAQPQKNTDVQCLPLPIFLGRLS